MVSMRHAEEHWHHQPAVTLLPSPHAFVLQQLAAYQDMSLHTDPHLALGPFPSALHSLQVKPIQALGLLSWETSTLG